MTTNRSRPHALPPIVAYDLSEWQGYLLPLIAPTLYRIPLTPGERATHILEQIPPEFRGLFAFHIDLTASSCCPEDRPGLVRELNARGIGTINANVVDISKRYVQSVCRRAGLNTTAVSQSGDPRELLIVKTNRNYGGKPEAHSSPAVQEAFAISPQPIHDTPDHGYLVLYRHEVPPEVWHDSEQVVERYIENKDQLFYRAYFVLNRVAISEGHEKALIKTIGRAERRRLILFCTDPTGEVNTDVPADLQPAVDAMLRFTKITAMQFGCLDILRDDQGRYFVIDMNATPHWGAQTAFRIIHHLSLAAQLPSAKLPVGLRLGGFSIH